MSGRPVYLDYQSTTPIDPRVFDAMRAFFDDRFGNPHSIHHIYGWDAAQALEAARACAAHFIGARVGELYFVSGATESCNLALRGVAKAAANAPENRRNRIVTVATEHPAVYETAADLSQNGFETVVLPVDSDGLLRLEQLENALDERALIVSVMAVNNEIGVLQPLREIGGMCREVGALFHTDATQAAGRVRVDVNAWGVDLLSFSAHKMYGPKGVGGLYVRSGVPIAPIASGGGQEGGLRSGTAAVPLAVGFGEACRIADAEWEQDAERMRDLTMRLREGVLALRSDARFFGCMRRRAAGSLSVGFPGVSADEMIASVHERVAVSSGSACSSASAEPSKTLLALGLSPETAAAAFRISLGRFTTAAEIETALEAFSEALRPFPSAPEMVYPAQRSDAMNENKLDLRFGPGSAAGFTSAGLTSFDAGLTPAAVVRELIQNSLDAAVEARKETAKVRFQLIEMKTADIPGIDRYREAFEAAVQTHEQDNQGTLPRQAQIVADRIKTALERETQEALCVLDNGVGLNEDRMRALLSDGVSAKAEGATGSFGNGHTVAIPASDLRYVLYGGVTKDGARIGSGHAVVASSRQANQTHPISADGYLVCGFKEGRFEFHQREGTPRLPSIISNKIDAIRRTERHGTAIVIAAFNNFREEGKTLWDMVSSAAACNFFQAIDKDKLTVSVEDLRPSEKRTRRVLDCDTLESVLKGLENEKRAKAFLSGQKAYECFRTLREGQPHQIDTGAGEIQLHLRLETASSSPRVDLCRNGMWIAYNRDIPRFGYTLSDLRPFHALLLTESGNRLHDLIRDAEGPLHNSLETKGLSKADRAELNEAFDKIKKTIRSLVPESGGAEYSPTGYFSFETDEGAGLRAAARPSPSMSTDGDDGRMDSRNEINGEERPRPTPDQRPRSVPTLRDIFSSSSRPDGRSRRCFMLTFHKDVENAELRLRVDENIDATCEMQRRDDTAAVLLRNAVVNGKPAPESALTRRESDGAIIGARLGNVRAGDTIRFETEYELRGGLSILPGVEPSLKAEVFRAHKRETMEK